MRRIEFSVGMNVVGARRTEIFEYPDEISDEEINQGLEDWVWEHIDCGWSEVEE